MSEKIEALTTEVAEAQIWAKENKTLIGLGWVLLAETQDKVPPTGKQKRRFGKSLEKHLREGRPLLSWQKGLAVAEDYCLLNTNLADLARKA